jgi:hypothetical protein
MRVNRQAVTFAKQQAKEILKPMRNNGTANGNFAILKSVKKDVRVALDKQGYAFSDEKLEEIVLNEMVALKRFQIGNIPRQVYWFRGIQVVSAIFLILLWYVAISQRGGSVLYNLQIEI